MRRVVVLGCGTGVGKTRLGVALLRELAAQGQPCIGLKPIESGIQSSDGRAPPQSDAHALSSAGTLQAEGLSHPLYALPLAVSPHLAARCAGRNITIPSVATWVAAQEQYVAPGVRSHMASTWTVIETAGGVFSPLSTGAANFDLAQALDPSVWVLVAADALGVLHDVSATLQAMRARGREPDHLVLSAARSSDASTGSNAAELATLGIATATAVLARNDDSGVQMLVRRLLALS